MLGSGMCSEVVAELGRHTLPLSDTLRWWRCLECLIARALQMGPDLGLQVVRVVVIISRMDHVRLMVTRVL